MKTSSPNKIASLDGLRGVSILIVFAGHADLNIYLYGSTGVTIFFFLSGFLITTLFRQEHQKTGTISLRKFYSRRALRILPAMYVTLFSACILSWTHFLSDKVSAWGIGAQAFHLTNYWIVFIGRNGLPSSTLTMWSLAVEEHYYLLFPLLLIGLLRRGLHRHRQAAVFASICALVVIWRIVLFYELHASYDRLYVSTDTRLDSILWGSVLALAANPALDQVRGSPKVWSWIVLPASISAFWAASHDSHAMTAGYTIEALSLVGIFITVIGFPNCWLGRLLNWRPVVLLGIISYPFYLVHYAIILILQQHTDMGKYALACTALAASLACAYVMHVSIDRPLARLRVRLRN